MMLKKETPAADETRFLVVHPLDDAPERKLDAASLGPMAMTRTVRFSLMTLRGYLILMVILVGYRALDLAGLFGHRH